MPALVRSVPIWYDRTVQPQYEVIDPDPGATSRWTRWRTGRIGWYWHCHAEVEITVQLAGRGPRHVGDHRADSRPGQALLIGLYSAGKTLVVEELE